jgi:hypothetical protein
MRPETNDPKRPVSGTDEPPFDLMLQLKKHCGLSTFVETRTKGSVASEWAWGHFRRVLMVEPNEPLARWVDKLQSPALIWLNGHSRADREAEARRGSTDQSLLSQCESLEHANPDHVIVVDDGQRFLEPDPGEDRPTLGQVLRALGCPTRRRALVLHNAIVALPLLSMVEEVLELGVF